MSHAPPPSTRRCRRLPTFSGDGGRRLAGSEALLEGSTAAGCPAIRWYTTRPTALYLGASQALAALDLVACRSARVSVYGRAAGGTVVLGDEGLLGLDVVLPTGDPLLSSDLVQSYRWLGEVWCEALHALGVAVDLVSVDTARAAARDSSTEARLARLACYGGLSPYEVTHRGRKVVGLAQVRRRHGALFQPAILLRWDANGLARLLAPPAEGRAALAAALAAHAVGLNDERPAAATISATAVIAAVEAALDARGLAPEDDDWSDAERALIERLERERYRPLPLT